MINKLTFFTLIGLCLIATQLHAGETKYLDFYEEEVRLFGVSDADHNIDFELEKRLEINYFFVNNEKNRTPGFAYDFADKINGDFCVVYRPSVSKNAKRFGFMTNLWGYYFNVDDSFALKLYLKIQDDPNAPSSWRIALVDSKGNKAQTVLKDVDTQGQWKEFSLPLADFKKAPGFDTKSIRLCQFETGAFAEKAIVKFDKIRFENNKGVFFGITDKSIEQRIAEQKATRQIRINQAYEELADGAPYPLAQAFAMMYLNRDLEKANAILIEEIKKYSKNTADHWSLFRTPIYCRFYYWFSSREGKLKGRMSQEAEKLLLETLWERTAVKNDIHWARQSTWNLDGSENHDLNSKACNLVTSRIFMNEPEYKDRIYPDYGFGGAYDYHLAGYYGKGVDPASRHGGGRANLKDGKEYKAKDHYEAWVKYMKEYFSERAKYGFFAENFSPGYSKHTMNFMNLIYSHSGDKELRKRVEDFLDLYWASWVQTGVAGVSGGPKTRHKGGPDNYDSNKAMIGFYLGGIPVGGVLMYWNLINDYQLPEVIQMMALDRENMNEFVYRARGIGEADEKRFNELGTERTLVCKQQSRFLKYTYVTPNYTIGTQMDHPLSIYSHSGTADRWQGMTVTEDADISVAPINLPLEPEFWGDMGTLKQRGLASRTLQHKNTLIVQRNRGYLMMNPAWFPLKNDDGDTGVYVGKSWDERVEKSGWVFLRKSDVYAAVRVVLWDEEFEKEKFKKNNLSRDKNSPIFTEDESEVKLSKKSRTMKNSTSAEDEPAAWLKSKSFNSLTTTDDDPKVKLSENCASWDKKNEMLVLKDRYAPIIIQAGNKKQFGSFDDFMQIVLKSPLELYKTVAPQYHIVVFTPPGKDAPEMVFNAANNEIPMLDGERINYEYPMTFESPFIKSKYGSGIIKIEYDGRELELDFNNTVALNDAGHGAAQPPLHAADFAGFAKKDTLDIFLLVGQSNMKGVGAVNMNPIENENILFFHPQKLAWYIARDPLHAVGTPDMIDPCDNAGTGPGLSFAQTLTQNDKNLKIGLIPAAIGGAHIDRYGNGGDLYKRSLAMVEQSVKESKRRTDVKAILWLQGEADSTADLYGSYEEKLLYMIDRYRKDLNNPQLPFIACTIGSFIKGRKSTHIKEINEILLGLPAKRKNVACVDARDLNGHIGDYLHYDTASQVEIGKRFAAEYLKLKSGQNEYVSTNKY